MASSMSGPGNMDTIRSSLHDGFRIPLQEGPSKVCTLSEAISRCVRPGMSVHLGCTHGRPYGLIYELIRQFWGKDPRFTLVSLGFTGPMNVLVHGGLAARCIASFYGDSYPTPGPNRVYQEAYRSGSVEFEHWSILTLPMRLKAAAMNVPGLPTRSLVGSTMETDNAGEFRVVPDPFDPDRRMGMVKALSPDIALLHGWVCDPNGNALFTPPYGEGFYGALASREGLILSVERVVTTDFIRRHSHLVRIPGFIVRAVVEVPMGSHPSGLSSQGIPELEAYADDYAFIEEARLASRDAGLLDAWTRRWVLETATQEEYLARLGRDRVLSLKGKARSDSWYPEFLEFVHGNPDGQEPSPAERMVAASAARMIEAVEKKGYKTILAGVGAANLAAWLAHRQLRERGCDVELMAEIGFYGYAPRPADPFVFNYRNMPTCKMLSDIEMVMGHLVCGACHRNLGAIGAGQVDRWGNVNSTAIPGHSLLVGSGGANDLASGSNEVLVVVTQERHRFPERVPYITSPGERVLTVVSDQGILEKQPGRKELVLTSVLEDGAGTSMEEKVREVREQCGWPLAVQEPLRLQPVPDPALVALLRCFDPRGFFLGGARI